MPNTRNLETISLITKRWSIFNLNMLRFILLMQLKDINARRPVFFNGYGVPFLSYYMLVFLIDLHKQLLFSAGKDPAPYFSEI